MLIDNEWKNEKELAECQANLKNLIINNNQVTIEIKKKRWSFYVKKTHRKTKIIIKE